MLIDGERYVVERLHAAKEFTDMFHAHKFVGHCHVPAWCLRSSQECSAIMPRMIAPMKMLYARPGTPTNTMPFRMMRRISRPILLPIIPDLILPTIPHPLLFSP